MPAPMVIGPVQYAQLKEVHGLDDDEIAARARSVGFDGFVVADPVHCTCSVQPPEWVHEDGCALAAE